jgi:predicted Zn-dependent peptidase
MASYIDTGIFGIYMAVIEEKINEAMDIVLRELEKLRDKEVDRDELYNAKEQVKGNMLLSLESTDSRMSRLAKCEIYHNEYITVEDLILNIDKVTCQGIRELAGSIIKNEYFTYTFLGPVKEKDITPETLNLN